MEKKIKKQTCKKKKNNLSFIRYWNQDRPLKTHDAWGGSPEKTEEERKGVRKDSFSEWYHVENFSGGTVDKHVPARAGDTGSIPGPGTVHTPQSHWACAPHLPMAVSLQSVPCSWRGRRSETPSETPGRREGPARHNWRKPTCSNADPAPWRWRNK